MGDSHPCNRPLGRVELLSWDRVCREKSTLRSEPGRDNSWYVPYWLRDSQRPFPWQWLGQVFLVAPPGNNFGVFTFGTPVVMTAFAFFADGEIQGHKRTASPVEQPSGHPMVLGNGQKFPVVRSVDRNTINRLAAKKFEHQFFINRFPAGIGCWQETTNLGDQFKRCCPMAPVDDCSEPVVPEK